MTPTLTAAVPDPARDAADLLTTEEAAARMKISTRQVRRLAAERRIVFYRLGRSVRFHPHDLDAFVTTCRIEPITETTVWNDLRRAA